MKDTEKNYYHELYEIAAEINSAGSMEKVLESTLAGICRTMGAKGCSLMFLTGDKKSLVHRFSFGLSAAFTGVGPRSVQKSLPETLIGKGKTTTVYDIAAEKDRVQFPEKAIEEGLVSILAVPVRLRDDIIGQLRVYTSEPRHFSDADAYFVQAVANLSAIALENVKLYESSRRAYDALTNDFIGYRFNR